jgi:hypothetical protein
VIPRSNEFISKSTDKGKSIKAVLFSALSSALLDRSVFKLTRSLNKLIMSRMNKRQLSDSSTVSEIINKKWMTAPAKVTILKLKMK